MRITTAALLVLAAAPAAAGPAPRTFKASVTQAAPLPAVPTPRVTSAELPPLPGTTVSTRGPLLAVPDPVLTPPRGRSAPKSPPLPPPNPFRTEGCPVTYG